MSGSMRERTRESTLPENVFDESKRNVFDDMVDAGLPKKRVGKKFREMDDKSVISMSIPIPKTLARKLRFIRAIESRSLSDIMREVLGKYIEKYEDENGELDDKLFFSKEKN